MHALALLHGMHALLSLASSPAVKRPNDVYTSALSITWFKIKLLQKFEVLALKLWVARVDRSVSEHLRTHEIRTHCSSPSKAQRTFVALECYKNCSIL
jgi:hypothetical protein